MSDLRPPATGTEAYLEAIHEVLCDIRTALVGGGQASVRQQIDERLGDVAAAMKRRDDLTPSVEGATPAKRTRTRTRGAAT